MLLKLEGYSRASASNRDEIVAASGPRPAGRDLLDVNLPGTDGFRYPARVRQHPALKEIPVIMLTAQTSRKDVFAGSREGPTAISPSPSITRPW